MVLTLERRGQLEVQSKCQAIDVFGDFPSGVGQALPNTVKGTNVSWRKTLMSS